MPLSDLLEIICIGSGWLVALWALGSRVEEAMTPAPRVTYRRRTAPPPPPGTLRPYFFGRHNRS